MTYAAAVTVRTTRAGVSAVADIPIRKKPFPQRSFNDFSENNVK